MGKQAWVVVLMMLAGVVGVQAATLPSRYVDTLPPLRVDCRMATGAGQHSRQLFQVTLKPRETVTCPVNGVRRLYLRMVAVPAPEGQTALEYTVLVPSGQSFQAYGPNRLVVGPTAGPVPFDFYLDDVSINITMMQADARPTTAVDVPPTGVPHHHLCTHCNGSGVCEACGGKGGRVCGTCWGTGKCQHCHGTDLCQACNGTGKLYGKPCTTCHGTGACQFCDKVGDEDHVSNGHCSNCHGTGISNKCGVCNGTGHCYYCGGTGSL